MTSVYPQGIETAAALHLATEVTSARIPGTGDGNFKPSRRGQRKPSSQLMAYDRERVGAW